MQRPSQLIVDCGKCVIALHKPEPQTSRRHCQCRALCRTVHASSEPVAVVNSPKGSQPESGQACSGAACLHWLCYKEAPLGKDMKYLIPSHCSQACIIPCHWQFVHTVRRMLCRPASTVQGKCECSINHSSRWVSHEVTEQSRRPGVE